MTPRTLTPFDGTAPPFGGAAGRGLAPAIVLFAIAGCGGGGGDANPATLWLANDQVETEVKLIDHEPPPF